MYLSMKTTANRSSIEEINSGYITTLQRQGIHRAKFILVSEKDDNYIPFRSTVVRHSELQFKPEFHICSTSQLRTVDANDASYLYTAGSPHDEEIAQWRNTDSQQAPGLERNVSELTSRTKDTPSPSRWHGAHTPDEVCRGQLPDVMPSHVILGELYRQGMPI